MMSRTHITVGAAAALAFSPITGIDSCVLALAAGAVGGVIPDVDIFDKAHKKDAFLVGLLSFGILFGGLIYYFRNNLLISDVMRNLAIFGTFCFDALFVMGFISEHRHFTHSLLAMLLFSVCVSLIYKPLVIPFAIGYISHLALDMLNRKGMQLFFPYKKGFCLRFCYADKLANKVLMIVGFIVAIALFAYHLTRFF